MIAPFESGVGDLWELKLPTGKTITVRQGREDDKPAGGFRFTLEEIRELHRLMLVGHAILARNLRTGEIIELGA